MTEQNAHAGQGAVVLDIGGDVGALVVLMPAGLGGAEIEARPVAAGRHRRHEDGPEHDHAPGAPVHVGVLARPVPDGRTVPSAVFAALPAGTYELYERPAGPVRLTVGVRGGTVTEAVWP